jgi:hypothetical protein
MVAARENIPTTLKEIKKGYLENATILIDEIIKTTKIPLPETIRGTL